MKKIVLFGCSGMLGNYIYYTLNNDYILYCFAREDFNIESRDWNKLEKKVSGLLDENDIVINCAGILPRDQNKNEIDKYITINTIFPHKLETVCIKNNYKFIHISSNNVFDGNKGKYYEDDIHTETTFYGISKSAGEPNNACIIRTSIIGEEINNKYNLLEWIISNNNKEIKGYTNHYWNGITCLTLAKIIKNIIDNNAYWNGARHIFSNKDISKYDLCCMVNDIYKLNINITKYETEKNIDMTLRTKYDTICIPEMNDLKQQLIEQKEFNIKTKINSRDNYAIASDNKYRFYLIHNLEKDRKFRMLNEFKKYNIDNNCVKWILHPNRDELTDEFIKKYTDDAKKIFDHYDVPYPLKRGQISCTYKHYLSLQDIVKNKYEYSVIIEDNIGFKSDVRNMLNIYHSQLPNNWSVLFDYDTNILPYNEKQTQNDILVYPKINDVTTSYHGGTRAATFYLLNYKTALELHNIYLPFCTEPSFWMNCLFRKLNIKSYWTHPGNVYVAPHISTSQL